jgi:hypothetical protein
MNKAREERWKERNKQRVLKRQEERLPPSTLEDEDGWEINTFTKDNHIENIYELHLRVTPDEKIFDMRGLQASIDTEHPSSTLFHWDTSSIWMFLSADMCIKGLNDLRLLRKYLLKDKAKVWVDDDTPISDICDCYPLFFSGLEFYSLDE